MKIDDTAVVEIVGSVLLLSMAVAAFSVIYMNVLSDDGPDMDSYLTVSGGLVSADVVFEHERGEEVPLESPVNLYLGGIDKITTTVGDLLSYNHNYIQDGRWNIGEQLVYHPEQNLTGIKIKADIVDKETNSMVFWGTLQEGLTFEHLGGIWHFDEPFWNGTLDEVTDSSGNENHGTALNNGTNTTGYPAISGRAGYFDCIKGAVLVKSNFTLNIYRSITIEAWVRPINEVGKLDYIEYGAKFAYYPNIIHVYKDVYAIVGENTQQSGVLDTVTISPSNGVITSTGQPEWTFLPTAADSYSLRANITHVVDDIYAIAYINQDHNAVLKTVNISKTGIISDTGFPAFIINTEKCYEPNIVRVSGNIFAIAYCVRPGPPKKADGFIKIVNISANGSISDTGLPPSFSFELGEFYEPNIIHVSNDTFVVAYSSYDGKQGDVFLEVINISSDGLNYNNTFPRFILDSGCYDPRIISVYGETYAVVYSGTIDSKTDRGLLKLININISDGLISDNNLPEKFAFEPNFYVTEPDITYGHDDMYVISYSNGSENDICSVKQINIDLANSTITLNLSYDYTAGKAIAPDIIKITDIVYAVVYQAQSAKPGGLLTIRLLRDLTNPFMRGIFKAGSVQIYARTWNPDSPTEGAVYASIVDSDGIRHEIVAPISNEMVWYHVVLTYDGSTIKLYCTENGTYDSKHDGLLAPVVTIEYSGELDISPSDLLIGHKFFGYIDELAILGYPLTPEQVTAHYCDPEILHTIYSEN